MKEPVDLPADLPLDVTVPRAPMPKNLEPTTSPQAVVPPEPAVAPVGNPQSFEITHTMIVQKPTVLEVRKVRLSIVEGPDAGRELITDKEWIRVGAHSSNDLVLAEDRTASRHHLEIRHTERGYLLVDLNSTNGTFIDGRRVERAYLSSGSQVGVGGSVIAFSPFDEQVAVELDADGQLGGMVGKSVKMRQIFGLIRKVAPMDISVVIQGETGTGKELVARAVHENSGRKDGPLVVLDCGAIPPNLIESELFGHEKGAFTGATHSRPGAFERAKGGTIFLDELGELQLDLQPKLLRVLENREVRRVGGNTVIPIDVRVIAATNRDLQKEIKAGNFREDLFFRLSVITVQLPPLRGRAEDIPHILSNTLNQPDLVEKHGRKRFTDASLEQLKAYTWPGNVRELMNVISHVLAFTTGEEIDVQHLPARVRGQQKDASLSYNEMLSFKDAKEELLENFEREYLTQLLQRCEGNISRAARDSGLHRKSIERLVKKYQLDTRAAKNAAKQ